MSKLVEVPCYYCNGTGKIKRIRQNKKWTEKELKKAFKLKMSGMTYRAVAKEMGITGSPQRVVHMINMYIKNFLKGEY